MVRKAKQSRCERVWSRRLADQQASGLSAAAWCRQKGVRIRPRNPILPRGPAMAGAPRGEAWSGVRLGPCVKAQASLVGSQASGRREGKGSGGVEGGR